MGTLENLYYWLSNRKRQFFCAIGLHTFDWRCLSGYAHKGTMTFCCPHCGKKIKTMPVDDVPEEYRNSNLEFLKEVKTARRKVGEQ